MTRRFRKYKNFIMGMVASAIIIFTTLWVLSCFNITLFVGNSVGSEIGTKAAILDQYIDKYYWKSVDDTELTNYALKGMVAGLGDKYSTYYSPEEYKRVLEGVQGSYIGIGIAVIADGDYVKVYSVTENKNAAKAGLQADDIILSIDGKDMKGKTTTDVSNAVDGEAGTKLEMKVKRGDQEVTLSIERENIVTETVTYWVKKQIGYIKVTEFDEITSDQFDKAVNAVEAKKAQGLVIDLRDNGGGSLTCATKMLDRLLPEGNLVTIKENGGDTVYQSTNKQSYQKPVVILINEKSASASEVFAGAMQDRGAAKLVGVKSFGKGIVQTVFELTNSSVGGAIKLTTSEYYLPSGRCIHQVGLTPDEVVEYKGKENEIGTQKDNQLEKALELVQKGE